MNNGLIADVAATSDEAGLLWRTGEDGAPLHLRATNAGIAAAMEDAGDGGFEKAVAPAPPTPGPDTMPDAAQPPEVAHEARQSVLVTNSHLGLRQAAQAVLVAWQEANGLALQAALHRALETLRTAVNAALPDPQIGQSREGTKQAQVLAMLRRDEGASRPQIAEAMGWAPHSVRGFLAGLAKDGITVEVVERVWQVGPDKTGAKGSYTAWFKSGLHASRVGAG